MEDTLRVATIITKVTSYDVLILVLMEDTLRGKQETNIDKVNKS